MPLTAPNPIRIFISSPSDVAPERAASLRAIELLNRRYAGLVQLKDESWEDHFFPATIDFQTWINQRIPPWNCQLVVCILWSRIGSPLSDAWPQREDGTRYESGTVAEFEMTRPHAEREPLPDLYMFLKTAALPGATTSEELRRAAEAKAVVENFVHRWFHQAASIPAPGSPVSIHPFTGGFNAFPSTEVFEDMFVRFLEAWLRDKSWIERPHTWDLKSKGLPYVGLTAFTATHSAVFFGRDTERRQARRSLIAGDAAGLPYLLISGDSGVGKSSLARAGVVADVCVNTSQEIWVPVVVVAGDNPLTQLADQLLAEKCPLRPHFAASFFPDVARLAPRLADPGFAVTAIPGALDGLAEAQRLACNWDNTPTARILLILDQAEALVEADPTNQREFVATMAALAGTRRVWIVATIRLDRTAALLELPALRQLVTRDLRGHGPEGTELKLSSPDEAATRDIIEAPALAAGLRFEERDGRSLAEELRTEVARQPDALPLLQRVLEGMFRDKQIARWEVYEKLGRLSGAISTAADAAVSGLSPEAHSALRPLLLALTGDMAKDGSVVVRPANRAEFETTPARAALVAALLDERLLILDGQGQMRVAHDALLRTWPKAQEILLEAEDFIRLRQRLFQHEAEWQLTGAVLPPGPLLATAEAALPAFQAEADSRNLATLVKASLTVAHRRRRRLILALSATSLVLLALVFSAGWFGYDAQSQRRIAEANASDAQTQRLTAEESARLAIAQATRAEETAKAAVQGTAMMVSELATETKDWVGVTPQIANKILIRAQNALLMTIVAASKANTEVDPEVFRQISVVYSELSAVDARTGDYKSAETQIDAATDSIENAVRKGGNSRQIIFDLLIIYRRKIDYLVEQGKYQEANSAIDVLQAI